MRTIRFSKNWNNKLNDEVFTTIRKSNKGNTLFYRSQINKSFNVILNHEGNFHYVCKATLIAMNEKKFKEVSLELLMTDTGLSNKEEIDELFRRFGISAEDEVLILEFRQ